MKITKNLKKTISLILLVLLIPAALFANGEGEKKTEQTIVFVTYHGIAYKFIIELWISIIENGLEGYKADYVPGDTMPIINGIIQGDVDVDMESWHQNVYEIYKKGIDSGNLIDLGQICQTLLKDGGYRRYLVEGPNALAPDLKSVSDLPKYAHLFKDPEDSSKGIVYGELQAGDKCKFLKKYSINLI